MSADDPFAFGGTAQSTDIADMAAIEFEPVADMDGVRCALSGAAWEQTAEAIGINLRIAATLLGKTKAELVDFARAFDEDAFFELVDSMLDSKIILKRWPSWSRTRTPACSSPSRSSLRNKSRGRLPANPCRTYSPAVASGAFLLRYSSNKAS